MLLLADVKDWLKTIYPAAEHFYCGKLDNKKEKSIGVYQRRPSGAYRITIGGIRNKSYEEKEVSILLHWTKYSGETEEAAFSLFEQIRDIDCTTVTEYHLMDENSATLVDENHTQLTDRSVESGLIMGKSRVLFIILETPEPIDVGTDDNGVYERVIWIKIYYSKMED